MHMKKVVYRETLKFCLVCRKRICKLELELISDFFFGAILISRLLLACNNGFWAVCDNFCDNFFVAVWGLKLLYL